MEILILHPENEAQLSAFKAMAKAMKVTFETRDHEYSPAFVAKVEASRKEVKEGKVTRVKKEDLQNFLGL